VAYTAKDVQKLRESTGVGMLDAKKALDATDGDWDEAIKHLRVAGLASASKRTEREANEGALAVVRDHDAAAIVALRCETDFMAKSSEFVSLVDEMAARVAAEGEDAVSAFAGQIETMLTTHKENISIGRVVRLSAGEGEVIGTYQHKQSDRGVNGVVVVLSGASDEVAKEVAIHAGFSKPQYVRRDEVPESDVAAERATIEEISRNEGKPEAALPKIIEGRLNAWFKDRVLLEQSYVKDEKVTVEQFLQGGTITAFAQVVVGV
jgi:elongation factor Ts